MRVAVVNTGVAGLHGRDIYEVLEWIRKRYGRRAACKTLKGTWLNTFLYRDEVILCLVPVGPGEEEELREELGGLVATIVDSPGEAEEFIEKVKKARPRWKKLRKIDFEDIGETFTEAGGEPYAALVEWLRKRGVGVKKWRSSNYLDAANIVIDLLRFMDSDDEILVVYDWLDNTVVLLLDSKQDLKRAAREIEWLEWKTFWPRVRKKFLEKHGEKYGLEMARIIDSLMARLYQYFKDRVVYLSGRLKGRVRKTGYELFNATRMPNITIYTYLGNGRIGVMAGGLVFEEPVPQKLYEKLMKDIDAIAFTEYTSNHILAYFLDKLVAEKIRSDMHGAVLLVPASSVPLNARRYARGLVEIGGRPVLVLQFEDLPMLARVIGSGELGAVLLRGAGAEPVMIRVVDTADGPVAMVVRTARSGETETPRTAKEAVLPA